MNEAAGGVSCGNPWDSQSERVYHGDGAWHSLNANSGGGQNRDAVLAFAQNQRDEVRDLKDVAGSLSAEPGMKQQTFVAAFMGSQGSEAGSIAYEEEKAPTLKAGGWSRHPDIIGPLCARDSKGVGNQYVTEGKVVISHRH